MTSPDYTPTGYTDGSGQPLNAANLNHEENQVDAVTDTANAAYTLAAAAVPASTATTKGDLLVATASATIARQAVGTDAQVLTADSTQTSGVKWSTISSGAPSGFANIPPTGLTYETVPRELCVNTQQLVTGTLTLVAIYLPAGTVVSKIAFLCTGVGASPTHWWFGLYDNNRVQLAVTADQTTTAWTTGVKSLNIATIASGASTTFTTTYSGIHYLGVMATATTLPTLASLTTTTNVGGQTPIVNGVSDSGQTTPPSFPHTATAITANTVMYWAAVDGTLGGSGSTSIRSLPYYAQANLTGSFHSERSLYLAPAVVGSGDVLSAAKAGLGRALVGTGYLHILAIGDSHTDGKDDDTSPTTGCQLNAWPEKTRARLVNAGVPDGGVGWVKLGGLLSPADTRWSVTGTWGRTGQSLWTWAQTTLAGNTATFQPRAASFGGTAAYFLTLNDSKPFSYIVKNFAGTTIASGTITGDTTQSVRVTSVIGLTDAYSAVLTTVAGTGTNWNLGAAAITAASGVIVSNMAISNSVATAGGLGWDKDPSAGGAQYKWQMAECLAIAGTSGLGVDLVTGTLGGNDNSVGTSASAIATALATIYGRFTGPSKLHIGNWPGNLDQIAMIGAMYGVADTMTGGFLDTYRRAGNYTTMNARGGYNAGSTVHPNQGPHAALGYAVADALLT